VCRDIKAYEAFFLDHLSRFPGVQSVNSSIALAVIKETTTLPLGSAQSTPSSTSSR
jgi:Lrp/AsnC family transcriptional regulator